MSKGEHSHHATSSGVSTSLHTSALTLTRSSARARSTRRTPMPRTFPRRATASSMTRRSAPDAIDTHQVLIEGLGHRRRAGCAPRTDRPAARRAAPPGRRQCPEQSTDTTTTQHVGARTDRAARPASIPASGPPPGGSSRVRDTPVGDTHGGRDDGHTRPRQHASSRAPHTRSIESHAAEHEVRLRDASQALSARRRRRRSRPDAFAARPRHTPRLRGLSPTARRSARRRAASPRPPSGRDRSDGSPKPTSSLMASVAIAVPAWPTTGPSTPTSGRGRSRSRGRLAPGAGSAASATARGPAPRTRTRSPG